jgi:hypothetical protein
MTNSPPEAQTLPHPHHREPTGFGDDFLFEIKSAVDAVILRAVMPTNRTITSNDLVLVFITAFCLDSVTS